MRRQRYRRLLWAAALAMLGVGCSDSGSSGDSQPRSALMRFAGVGVVADTPADDYGHAEGSYAIGAQPDGSTRGSLYLSIADAGGFWEGRAPQVLTVPVGTRYLDEGDVGEWALHGAYQFEEGGAYITYEGIATARWMHLDLADGAVYLTLDVRLAPEEASAGPVVEGRVDVWGYVTQTCRAPQEDRGTMRGGDGAEQPPFCPDYWARVSGTPRDPDAPPPPFDQRDVIDCTVGQPCEGQGPSAPWPGPPREGG